MSNHEYVLEAQSREALGSGASRRLRHEGKVPAVVYGDDKPAQSVILDHNKLWHAAEHENFFSSIIDLKIEGKKQQAIVKDMQRHPHKQIIMHADYLRVAAGKPIHMNVPLHFTGEDEAPGVKDGGVVTHSVSEVEIEALPKNLPEYLEVDLSTVEMDGVVHLSDIVPPEGVTILALAKEEPNDMTVASIHEPKVIEEPEEEVAEEAAEGETTAEGEAAAEGGESDETKEGGDDAAAPAAE